MQVTTTTSNSSFPSWEDPSNETLPPASPDGTVAPGQVLGSASDKKPSNDWLDRLGRSEVDAQGLWAGAGKADYDQVDDAFGNVLAGAFVGNRFSPIDATGSGTSVRGVGEAMSFEEFRRQEVADRNRTEGVDAVVQDADLSLRGSRLSAADFAAYEALGAEMGSWQVNKAFRSNDPNHFVLGAYSDGTWNKRPGEDLLDTRPGIDNTNVGLLQLLSQGAQNTNFQTKYFPGVGTDWYTKHVGGATGAGVTMGAEDAYKWISDNVNETHANNRKATFDFLGVGFSRGSLETRMLLRMIDQRGIPDYASRYEVMRGEANIEVRYERNIIEPGKANLNAVIFDTVTTGAGDFYNIDLPTRTQAYHPIARDEMRALFPSAPLARVGQEMSPSWFQPVVAGDHSDIGNNHDRGGIGDMNLKLAHQFMSQKLGLPMMAIPSAYTPIQQNMWIHDMRGNDGIAPRGNSPFVRPVAPRYMSVQPNQNPF